MTLSDEDKEALRECFAEFEPQSADYVARMTGLSIPELKTAGIVRTLGRWGQALYKGEQFPN